MNKSYVTRNSKKLIGAGIAAIFGAALIFAIIQPYRVTGQSLQAHAEVVKPENSADARGVNINPRAAAASFSDIVEKVSPSVVTIRADIVNKNAGQDMSPFFNDPMLQQFFGGKVPQAKPQSRTEHALGSGVIVGEDGTILTNNHVVDGAQKIQVELSDRKSFTAKVIGTDPLSDLAVLKIDAANLPALALGDSDKVRVGDVVLALGNPLGLQQTVTSGIISAKGRQTGLSDGAFEDFLQTDAAINQGNSGGALVDVNGELIGINSQILSPSGGNIGIGFAIPSNMAKTVMEQLVLSGKVRRGQLGVGIQNLNSDLAENFGLKDVNGVLVNAVKAGSPAESAGIKQGDVITAVDGTKVTDTNELRNRVASTAPGTEIGLTLMRDGREQTVSAKLSEFSPEKAAANGADGNNQENLANPSGGEKLGLTVEPLTPAIARQIGLKNITGGLVVTDVRSGSKAEDAGLQPGDVIMQINRQSVNGPADIGSALAKSGEKPVLLLVNRQNQTIYLTV